MKKIKLTGYLGADKFALVDEDDYEMLSKYKWHLRKDGYAGTSKKILRTRKTICILLHRLVMNASRNQQVDHKNRNRLDCRGENLRICSPRQNLFNRGKFASNGSKYIGVYMNDRGKWYSSIQHCGIPIYLGMFPSELSAAIAYNEVASKLRGEFAVLNDVGQDNEN